MTHWPTKGCNWFTGAIDSTLDGRPNCFCTGSRSAAHTRHSDSTGEVLSACRRSFARESSVRKGHFLMILNSNGELLGVYEYPLLTAEQCAHLRADAEGSPDWTPAGVYRQTGKGIDLAERSVLGVPLLQVAQASAVDALVTALVQANDDHFRLDLDGIPSLDLPSVLRYDAGSADHFRSHRDMGRESSTRKLTFSVQLSDPGDYGGCALVFTSTGRTATRELGHLIVFPSFEYHHVTPVLWGRRYAVVGWIHGSTFS